MNLETAYRDAAAHADLARARLSGSVQAAKARITPGRLKQDAIDKASGVVLDGIAIGAAKAQQRPVAIGAAAGALALFLFRRPLAALFGRLYVRISNPNPDNSETDDG